MKLNIPTLKIEVQLYYIFFKTIHPLCHFRLTRSPMCFNSTTIDQSINVVKKGKPFLNYFINFPYQVLLDYMHVCVRRPQERLLYIWFNSKKSQENY